jgi:hypothetical protein
METKLNNIYINSEYGVYSYEVDRASISKDCLIEISFFREREKMGGNRGIHLPPTNTNTEEDGN